MSQIRLEISYIKEQKAKKEKSQIWLRYTS